MYVTDRRKQSLSLALPYRSLHVSSFVRFSVVYGMFFLWDVRKVIHVYLCSQYPRIRVLPVASIYCCTSTQSDVFAIYKVFTE